MSNQLELHLGKNATEISINIITEINSINITWEYAKKGHKGYEGHGGISSFPLSDLNGFETRKYYEHFIHPDSEMCELHLNFSNYHIILKYGKASFDKFEEHKKIVRETVKYRNFKN